MSANPTAYEQYLLELINRARANPNAQAAELGIGLNDGLAAGQISAAAKQPLVLNELLINAARAHSDWMLAADIFSHTGVNGSDPGDRMEAAGYYFGVPSSWGENIAYTGTTGNLNATTATFENHNNLFKSPGHRVNLMDGGFKEIGVATQIGQFTNNGTTFNAMMVTENFATSGTTSYLTGVVLNDTDADRFYDIGEGVGAASIVATGTAGTFQTSTWGAGGYTLALPQGSYAVTISYAGKQIASSVTIGSQNVKLDAMLADMTVGATPSPSLGTPGNDNLVGSPGPNIFNGSAGTDVINGGGGLDLAVYAGNHAAFSWSLTGSGSITLNKAGGGRDTLTSVERVAFDDGVLATDISGVAGQAYRIYQAAFDRTPDTGGLIYWIDRMDKGSSLYEVSLDFIWSAEFRQVYGVNVSNADFIGRLYENILGREGEAGGTAYWVGELDTGVRDKASVLAGFSESPENVSLVGQAIGNGIWLPGADAA